MQHVQGKPCPSENQASTIQPIEPRALDPPIRASQVGARVAAMRHSSHPWLGWPGLFAVAVITACAVLASVSPGMSAQGATVPRMSFSGDYTVTFRVTNVKGSPPTVWVYQAKAPCVVPCSKLSFRLRLKTEKQWRHTSSTFHWTGRRNYETAPKTLRNYADCRSKSGARTRTGYDVTGRQAILMTRAVNGRVTEFTGSGTDTYKPNAKGRKSGCVAGTYVFAITGASR